MAILSILNISKLKSGAERDRQLLLKRQALTEKLQGAGLVPPLILSRAYVYELLGYDDLAAADAFVVYTLCESVRGEEWVTDLEPMDVDGEPWQTDGDDNNKNLAVLCSALVLLCRTLARLGATQDAEEKYKELVERRSNVEEAGVSQKDLESAFTQCGEDDPCAEAAWLDSQRWFLPSGEEHKFGWARREIYRWNEYEPDRNSSGSIAEINSLLSRVAPDLRAKVTALPALNDDGSQSNGIWYQLGLFAAKDLSPGTKILQEKSVLTAIRPLDDALCDACGADLESTPREAMRQCPGDDCDTTFCSEDCATRAGSEYHKPNISPQKSSDHDTDNEYDDDDEGADPDYPPPHAPFCGNAALHEIGRTSTTTTPEFDLYFLLLTRTIQLSTTQSTHPLSLSTTKYLWGDFNPPPPPNSTSTTATTSTPSSLNTPRTLPWSLHHNLTLPLQYFETLMHSLPDMTPYSAQWLATHDWWIQSTLYAKFRGVANAQQSTFDGKAEIAAVHPLWCLANHSCKPNVRWTPTGERVFVVRGGNDREGDGDGEMEGKWNGDGDGIKEGQEIWSHYTDVRLPVKERRERLMEVLGGICRCERCIEEAGDS